MLIGLANWSDISYTSLHDRVVGIGNMLVIHPNRPWGVTIGMFYSKPIR
ncbi:MAG: hypothetical protein KC444_03850 [Nitrosopumilus sp.]|nr:hypothetical protein [Nitrosopumilus sp.]